VIHERRFREGMLFLLLWLLLLGLLAVGGVFLSAGFVVWSRAAASGERYSGGMSLTKLEVLRNV
jgi:hypothetical protein